MRTSRAHDSRYPISNLCGQIPSYTKQCNGRCQVVRCSGYQRADLPRSGRTLFFSGIDHLTESEFWNCFVFADGFEAASYRGGRLLHTTGARLTELCGFHILSFASLPCTMLSLPPVCTRHALPQLLCFVHSYMGGLLSCA